MNLYFPLLPYPRYTVVIDTPPKFNSEFAPEVHGGWKENDPFLFGFR